jgi:hypothetical protein
MQNNYFIRSVKLPPPEAVACFVGQAEPAPKQEGQICSYLPSYSTGGASGFHVQITGSVNISSPMCQYVMKRWYIITFIDDDDRYGIKKNRRHTF